MAARGALAWGRERAGAAAAADRAIRGVSAAAYTVPTERPQSDGTLEWDATTIVIIEVEAGGAAGLGYSYTHAAAAELAAGMLARAVRGMDALDVPAAWSAMLHAVRNIGRGGVVASAISAVDAALWDLKAKLLDLPLCLLLGRARDAVPAYGSGGFTSYTDAQLVEQLGGWADAGFRRVKMKVGREPERDLERVRAAREAIGPDVALGIDANGAFRPKTALALAGAVAALGVDWFEEPVPSDDVAGLRRVRDRAPAGMDIAAGEYGWQLSDFRRLIDAGAVDVLQADATRCLGLSGFLRVGALCEAAGLPLSAHTAPSLHVAACCALEAARDVECFHDHARIERLFFDGAARPRDGLLRPDLTRPGLGLELKRADAERHRTG